MLAFTVLVVQAVTSVVCGLVSCDIARTTGGACTGIACASGGMPLDVSSSNTSTSAVHHKPDTTYETYEKYSHKLDVTPTTALL
ncbi:hypothetical protein BDR26DRAFT_941604 [Obelidium mucronatum]|nr:hypothetical protein BDR26DRAFT_941604 [Obelidium mucronatum]